MFDMKITDAVTVEGTRRLADGYLYAEAFAVRTGIQLYTGDEVGRPDLPVVRVYRSEAVVRDAKSMATFSHAPITIGHPDEFVTADNWKQLAVGEVSTEAVWKDGKIKMPLIFKDAAAIAAIEDGVRELSAGYKCRLTFEDGVTPEGEEYDAKQTDIVVNHLALVRTARGGKDLRVGDGSNNWGARPFTSTKGSEMPEIKTQMVVVGDEAVETTDAGARAITMLKGQVAALEAKITTDAAAHAATVTAKDTQIGTLTAELKTAKDAANIDVDALAANRALLITQVKALDGTIETQGKSDADLRKLAVTAKLGDALVKDASADMVAGMFTALVKASGVTVDPVAAVLGDAKPIPSLQAEADKARTDYIKNLGDSWKTPSTAAQ